MLEQLDSCPICQETEFSNYITCKDYMITNESFNIAKCKNCSFLFTNPRPDEKNLASYYKSEQYISHTDKSNNLTNTLYKIARVITLNRKVKLISHLTDEKTILDYGCGTGDFLTVCKQHYWKIYGYEPDDDARLLAEQKTEIKIQNQLENLSQLSNISIITLWHVLEHVPDLNKTLNILKTISNEKGVFVIAVPNHRSYDAQIYKEHWAAYDVPRHLYHFSQTTMQNLLKNHGLKLAKIIPMKLDSFYVSLLSEKYKTGSSNMVKSFINGCKSNIYAKKNDRNFSSLIYVAHK